MEKISTDIKIAASLTRWKTRSVLKNRAIDETPQHQKKI
jgi:hypothetical protein